jgi:hypothetical protein
VDFAGTWRNQIGSTMTITVAGQAVTGEYVSTDSSNNTTAKGRLVGSVDGDLIAFVVNWDDYLSLTAWTGQLVGAKLKTLWLLVKDTAEDDEALKLWQSTNAGADEFTKIV